MKRSSLCLVLGAGASIAMGYPVGLELRKKIIQREANLTDLMRSGIHPFYPAIASRFFKDFRDSQMASIDAFLARRSEFQQIGKIAIAGVLLDCENVDLLHTCEHPDNWYFYLYNQIAAETWSDLDFSWLSIVTFNYDRSFESYLLNAMQSSYGKTLEECLEKFETATIIHVYGDLAGTNPARGGYIPYGGLREGGYIAVQAATPLRVIPEGRDDDPTLRAARERLTDADRIAFLGFGFDPINMRRLATHETCKYSQARADGVHVRSVVGTCKGLTEAERRVAVREATGERMNRDEERNWPDASCVELLRSTRILDQA